MRAYKAYTVLNIFNTSHLSKKVIILSLQAEINETSSDLVNTNRDQDVVFRSVHTRFKRPQKPAARSFLTGRAVRRGAVF